MLLSCDSIFHEEDIKYIVPNTKQEKIDLVNGMYSCLVKVHNEDYFKALIRSDDVNIYTEWSFSNCYLESAHGSIDFSSVTGSIFLNLSLDITLLFLPSYSPKLNIIERLWKFTKKKILYAKYYETPDKFHSAITDFFHTINQKHNDDLKNIMTLNFSSLNIKMCLFNQFKV